VAAMPIIVAELSSAGSAPPHILARHIKMDMYRDTYPFDGAVFAFRGRRAGLIKLIWHDGVGLCMLSNHLSSHYTCLCVLRGF